GSPNAGGNKASYRGLAMRTDRYRYVEWTDKRTGEIAAHELYDHQTDPQENENIFARADKALLDELAGQARGYWKTARPQ
ncbi:MAG: iduronate sulfatase, partial [Verrucomicrobiota bacterium]|nr:iduronate sulfatase [Verrucomicrobiota bacterium]